MSSQQHTYGAAEGLEAGTYGYSATYRAVPGQPVGVGGARSMVGPQHPHDERKTVLRGTRRRMNWVAIVLSWFLPSTIFFAVLGLRSMPVRIQQPALCALGVGFCFLACLVAGVTALAHRRRWYELTRYHEPSWLSFLAMSMLVAFIFGVIFGDLNFQVFMQAAADLSQLNTYHNVSTAILKGQQLMDAGMVTFMPGTKLDVSKSMGFKSGRMYCAAPIVSPNNVTQTYDFWAVGTDCCTAGHPDFHCRNFNNLQADGGVRLMNEQERPFFRLAVQQAEATYNITAAHPLFFEWAVQPTVQAEERVKAGCHQFLMFALGYMFVQAVLVVWVTLVFAKL